MKMWLFEEIIQGLGNRIRFSPHLEHDLLLTFNFPLYDLMEGK
jgi:hypothetical protein